MNWAAPAWLLALALVPVLGALIALGARRSRNRFAKVLSEPLLDEVLPRSVRIRRALRDLAALAGLALAVIALAEPRFDKQIRTVKATGTDLVVLLDLSRSMDARDVDPSRLERARREIADLGKMVAGDRVGLVVFAGGAYPRLPLTQDFRALELIVGEAETDTFQSQGSNLAAALEAAQELLSRSQDQAGQAILVLSDGETHQPDAALEVAGRLAQAGVSVYAMGIGVEPSPIPMPNGRLLEHGGQVATTAPDFEILEQVARTTGGAFVTSNASDRDMQGLYSEIRRNLKAVERSAHQRESWRTAFHWPLSAGALLLLFAGWLGDGRRPWGAALAALVALQLLAPGRALAADTLLEADRLFREGDYARAAERLTELSLERPEDPAIFERLGAARYRAGDFEGASRAFDHAARLEGGTDDLFNSGNAHYKAGRLEDAQARYEQVLEKDPEHRGALANRDLVLREIEERRRIQPEPPPQQGGEGDEDGDGEEGDEKQSGGGQGQSGGKSKQQQGTDSEPQDSQSSQPTQQGGDTQGSEGTPSRDSNDPQGSPGEPSQGGPDEPGTNDAVAPDQVGEGQQSDGEPQAAGGTGTMGEDTGPITEGQAHRLLDAIEEGSQRVTVQGRTEDKPW